MEADFAQFLFTWSYFPAAKIAASKEMLEPKRYRERFITAARDRKSSEVTGVIAPDSASFDLMPYSASFDLIRTMGIASPIGLGANQSGGMLLLKMR